MRIPERLTNIRLATAKLMEAKQLLDAAFISSRSIEDELSYLHTKELEFENMIKAGHLECSTKSSLKAAVPTVDTSDLKYK